MINILTDSLLEVFGRTKLHKKYLEIYFLLKKVIVYCVSNNINRHFLCQILLCTNTVLENLPQNRKNILKYN